MNFFEHQEAARKKTGRLVFLFVLAVISIVALLFVASMAILEGQVEDVSTIALPILVVVTAVTLLIVGGGSFYKTAQLSSGGGSAVADMLGGTSVQRETADPEARKLLNVVEEMAIASGTPMPAVYVMNDEAGINAFAAGHTIDDAVIGVTRGTIHHLTRDELQGVIAHEFSHIFNGDMRLNLRLMGVLHGILLIGLIGNIILRGMYWTGSMHSSRRRRSKGDGDGGQAILLFGLALTVIGFVGTFFGGLIKSAISRQREYLADASAVQFTRNPDGIGGALKKIGALSEGALLMNPRAAEASHLFFGQGIKSTLGGLTATHPPLAGRIQRIDPTFDGDFSEVRAKRTAPEKPKQEEHRPEAAQQLLAALAFIGAPSPSHVAYARKLVDGIPGRLHEAIGTPWGARAVVFALLLDTAPEVRANQFARIEEHSEADLARETHQLAEHLDQLAPEARLPLLDLAMPSLRALSPAQFERFAADLEHLIQADRKLDLFEWVLTRIIQRHVGAAFKPKRATRVRFRRASEISAPTGILLSALAQAGAANVDEAKTAFRAGAGALSLREQQFEADSLQDFDRVDQALSALREAAPALKKMILAGCAATIAADHQVTVRESELFRAIADTLECPVPPLLAGQALPAHA